MLMFHFQPTTDLSAVRSILTHPSVYSLMADDYMPDRSMFAVTQAGGVTFVLVKRGPEPMGVVLVVRRNQLHCELHVCMLPRCWGRAESAARTFIPWFWAHFPYRRAIGNIPECNRAALRFSVACGFDCFGRNPKVFQKGGNLYDEIWVGIDRPEAA